MAASLRRRDRRPNLPGAASRGDPAPSLTFVKPGLLKHLDALEQLGLEFEFRHLGNDVFNEVGWLDPSGQLGQARSKRARFHRASASPTTLRAAAIFWRSRCRRRTANWSKAYWEDFGFVGMEETQRPSAAHLLHQRLHRSGAVSSGGFAARNPAVRGRRCRRHPRPACRKSAFDRMANCLAGGSARGGPGRAEAPLLLSSSARAGARRSCAA